jgi:hypothetical protein
MRSVIWLKRARAAARASLLLDSNIYKLPSYFSFMETQVLEKCKMDFSTGQSNTTPTYY